jgi:RHS repeat-associated protein
VGETRIVTKRREAANPTLGQEIDQQYFYHTDHLGSAQMITNTRGTVTEHIEYTPYGELWIEQRLDAGAAKTPFRFTGKELDSETGLYYYGARYLNPKTSLWLSTDPAMDEYVPGAPVNDEVRKQNQNLPGMGGVFNVVNLHTYHYAGNNPVKYTDPDGKELRITFFVTEITENEKGGITARGYLTVHNTTTGHSFIVEGVFSGGITGLTIPNDTKHAPFGKYDILQSTHEGRFYYRLEAADSNYGDDYVNFEGQEEHSLLRFHPQGGGTSLGCVAFPQEYLDQMTEEFYKTSTTWVDVESKTKGTSWKALLRWEAQEKFGELTIVDATR